MHPCVHGCTIPKAWKQPKCPLTDEWIKMWYIYTMEYYTAIKRNKIVQFVEMWMDLQTVIQSEVSQKEKNKYIISLIYRIQKNDRYELICKAEVENGHMSIGARGGMN